MSITEKIYNIFYDEFEDSSLVLSAKTNADDIEDWDSLANINLLIAMENEFEIKFNMSDIQSLQDLGGMIDLVTKMTSE